MHVSHAVIALLRHPQSKVNVKSVAHPKRTVRWQCSDSGISMEKSALYGGTGNFDVSIFAVCQ
jgi:hypothetical protein